MLLQRHILQISFLTFWNSYTSSTTMCYYPDGSDASTETPCPEPASSSCCPGKSSCLTNGLCWDSRNFMFRGSCRDKSWTDPNCPKFCRQYSPYSGKVLAPCNDAGLFTCNYQCTVSNFTVPRGDIVLRDNQLTYAVFASSSHATFASISSTFSSPSPTSTPPPLNIIPNGNCTINSADHPSAKKSPSLATVAAGVGVPLGLAWLATLVCFGRERHKTRLLEQEKSHLGGSVREYQPAKWSGNPQKLGGKSAELRGDRAPHEIAAEPLTHELQA